MRQVWTVGSTVSVGFMRDLTVLERIPTPGDHKPDAYLLRDSKGRIYRAVPYNGMERLS